MPAEYTECVKSYTNKGISEKVAKARCAAMYYKRNGISVNEAAKKEGIASSLDYDEALANALVAGKAMTVVAAAIDKGHDTWIKASVIASDIFSIGDGYLEVIMTKPGAKANCSDGHQLTWTEKVLQEMSHTWTGGTLSANHVYDGIGSIGEIIYAWYDSDGAHGVIKPLPEVYDIFRLQPELINGVSIEAGAIKYDDNFEITSAKGTGLAIILDPVKPQCSEEEGCKILASTVTEVKTGETMSEDVKNIEAAKDEKICPAVHKQVVAQKDELAAKVVAYEKEVADLKAMVESYRESEKASVLASIKDCVDTEAYKDKDLDTLKVIAKAVLEAKKKMEAAPIEYSGADPTATIQANAEEAELTKKGYTPQEIAEYKAMAPELKKYGLVK